MSTVVCVECQRTVPASQVDLSARGWLCQTCRLQQQIDVHSGADHDIGHISLEQMQQRADTARAGVIVAILASVLCGALLLGGAFSPRVAARAFWAVPAGIVFAGYEIVTWRRARRAVAIMRTRESRD